MPSAMRQDGVGWGPVARGSPSPRRGPVQAPGHPVWEEELQQKLEALWPELGGEHLRSHKLRCWARPEGPPAHWGHQETQRPCSPEEHGPRALAARLSLGLSGWRYRRHPLKATALGSR